MSSSCGHRLGCAILAVALLFPGLLPAADTPRKSRSPETAIMPVDRTPKRHAQFLERIKTGDPIDLLFLGASIVDFWPLHGPDTWARFAPYHPANFGVAGDCTEHLLWRVQNGELDGIHPKVVVLLIGNNNLGHFPDEQPAWAADGVRQIIGVIHAKIPAARVLLLAAFPRDTKDSSNRQRNTALNVELAKLDGDRTDFLDIGPAFLEANGEISRDIMPDLLHPNASGYQRWYDAMQPTLDQLMK